MAEPLCQADSLASELFPLASQVFLPQHNMKLGQQNGAHMILSDSSVLPSLKKKKNTGLGPCTP